MLIEKMNAELTSENEDLAIQKVEEFAKFFPFMVSLNPKERMRLPKIGRRSTDFVDTSFLYMKENPDLVSSLIDFEQAQKDMAIYKQLQRVLVVLGPVYKDLSDTNLMAGSKAYQAALEFYDTVKSGVKRGRKKCESIYNDLAPRFSKSFNQKNGPEGTENGQGEVVETKIQAKS